MDEDNEDEDEDNEDEDEDNEDNDGRVQTTNEYGR